MPIQDYSGMKHPLALRRSGGWFQRRKPPWNCSASVPDRPRLRTGGSHDHSGLSEGRARPSAHLRYAIRELGIPMPD